ncbi:hypothetical protein F5J12DRAFT_490609 [Pisolithus orientalis]|uniref:uncharacterized protein n=1 Tax=Pisolithus orientalis TaxID=936130 RepID=UPI002224A40B|nr:uncharacterized protein F5J12DRAFT_490609 [Pisolithus orientalis]KAI6019840.1 hypothetical protein F5J12DRAFT_490609 [Pisolithus orientalis]
MGRSPGQPIREVKCLTEVKPWLIKEPTAPVDILGHAAKNAEAIVWCWRRTLIIGWFSNNFFKQIQLTCARLIPALLLLISMARPNSSLGFSPSELGLPVCYSSELDRLYRYFWNEAWLEFAVHLYEHLVYLCSISFKGRNSVPLNPAEGYSIEILKQSIAEFEWPQG